MPDGDDGEVRFVNRLFVVLPLDFGPAIAVRWATRVETTGDVAPLKMGRRPQIASHRGARRVHPCADQGKAGHDDPTRTREHFRYFGPP